MPHKHGRARVTTSPSLEKSDTARTARPSSTLRPTRKRGFPIHHNRLLALVSRSGK